MDRLHLKQLGEFFSLSLWWRQTNSRQSTTNHLATIRATLEYSEYLRVINLVRRLQKGEECVIPTSWQRLTYESP